MNYLAHLHLSDGTPESMVGNLFADFVKGPDVAALPAAIQRGVRMHRAVDSYTDRHPVVVRSIRRLGGKLGWFAGIVVDVYYDHLLARNWSHFSDVPLRAFVDRAYRILADNVGYLRPDGRAAIGHLIRDDRLASYATAQGIEETLERLSWRIMERMPKREVRLHDSMPDLLAADADLEADFRAFYPQLVAFADQQKTFLPYPKPCSLALLPAVESRR